MRYALTISVFAVLVGCGPDVDRVENDGESVVRQTTQSCSTVGYCITCGLGFDGSFSCGPKLSMSCPGSQSIEIRDTPVLVFYKDGTKKRTTQTVVTHQGPCQ